MGYWTRGTMTSPPEYEYSPGEEEWLTNVERYYEILKSNAESERIEASVILGSGADITSELGSRLHDTLNFLSWAQDEAEKLLSNSYYKWAMEDDRP